MDMLTRRGARAAVRAAAMGVLVIATFAPSGASSNDGLAPFPGALNIVPEQPSGVGNCIPFANNTDFGFSGFIYRDVPPFALEPGTPFAFDLGGANDVDIRRDIYFAQADHNPQPGNGNVRALEWVRVASEEQVPGAPRGNSVVGDYELTYVAESTFIFAGGGLIIGFGSARVHPDTGCEPVLVHTTRSDPSGYFFGRFWSKSDRTTGFLDRGTFATTNIGGVVIFGDSQPPEVSAVVDPSPGPDGWVDHGPATVTWSATDEGSGVAGCDTSTEIAEPGVHEVTGSCSDNAGNVGTASVTVRLARTVEVDLMPNNPTNPVNPDRRGEARFLIRSAEGFAAHTVHPSAVTFGARGTEPSVSSCSRSRSGLLCRFDVVVAGFGPATTEAQLRGFADDGIKIVGSDAVRIVGKR